jgi:hypothetical protein
VAGHNRGEVGFKVGCRSTLPGMRGAMGGGTCGGAGSLGGKGGFGRRFGHFCWLGRASGGAVVGAGGHGGGIGGVGLAHR